MNHYEQATQEVRDAFNALCKGRVEAAVKAEREACAKEVENYALGYAEPVWSFKLASIIRDRGET